ncbi:MAG: VWA domain-containing protein, partial [Gemmatimonadaceae bacterium]
MTVGSLNDAVEFAENPEPRCPCVLLLDTSGSMHGRPIDALNEGLWVFKMEVCKDALAARRVEVAVVTFDDTVKVPQPFIGIEDFEPPVLTAQGLTHMGAGLDTALDLLQVRKRQYKLSGITYYRPWVFLITDGEPQGEPDEAVQRAAARVRDDEASKRVACFAVGVEGANLDRLRTIVAREPVRLRGLNFRELFVWL